MLLGNNTTFSGWKSGPIMSYRFVGVLSFSFSSSFDLHSVIRCFTVKGTPLEMHSIGIWFFMRCSCVRWLWPILSRFIIISVFLEVLDCGHGFMLCLFFIIWYFGLNSDFVKYSVWFIISVFLSNIVILYCIFVRELWKLFYFCVFIG